MAAPRAPLLRQPEKSSSLAPLTEEQREKLERQKIIGEKFSTERGGILVAPPGAGKTAVLMAAVSSTVRDCDYNRTAGNGFLVFYVVNTKMIPAVHVKTICDALSILGTRRAKHQKEINSDVDGTFIMKCKDNSPDEITRSNRSGEIKVVVTKADSLSETAHAISKTEHGGTIIVLTYRTFHEVTKATQLVSDINENIGVAAMVFDEADTLIGNLKGPMKQIEGVMSVLVEVQARLVIMATATPPNSDAKRAACSNIVRPADSTAEYDDLVLYMDTSGNTVDIKTYKAGLKRKHEHDDEARIPASLDVAVAQPTSPKSPKKKARIAPTPQIELINARYTSECSISTLAKVANVCIGIMLAPRGSTVFPKHAIRNSALSALESIVLSASTGVISAACVADITSLVMERTSFCISNIYAVPASIFEAGIKPSGMASKKFLAAVAAANITRIEDNGIGLSSKSIGVQVNVIRALLVSLLMRSAVLRMCKKFPVFSEAATSSVTGFEQHQAFIVAECYLWKTIMEAARAEDATANARDKIFEPEMQRISLLLDQLQETSFWKFASSAKELFAPFFSGDFIPPINTMSGMAQGSIDFCAWLNATAKSAKNKKLDIGIGFMSSAAAEPWLDIVKRRAGSAPILLLPHRSKDVKSIACLVRKHCPELQCKSYDSSDKAYVSSHSSEMVSAIDGKVHVFVMGVDFARSYNMPSFDALILQPHSNCVQLEQAAGRVTREDVDRVPRISFLVFEEFFPTTVFKAVLPPLAQHIKSRSTVELKIQVPMYNSTVYTYVTEKLEKLSTRPSDNNSNEDSDDDRLPPVLI